MRQETNSEVPASSATRRQAMLGAAIAFGGLALSAPSAWAADQGVSQTAESIHQEPVIKATRQRVYEALTDTKQFDKIVELSGAKKDMKPGSKPTEISPALGGTFTIFGGHIIGRHLEFVPNERIVQAWRVVDWEPGIYSIARFALVEQGSGTKIVFDHTGFPKGLGEHLASGWKQHYWEPMAKLFA